MGEPNCIKCVHYFVTYDPQRPRGCRKFSFQSNKQPALLVKEETGSSCMAFEEKSKRKKKGLDLNDPSLW